MGRWNTHPISNLQMRHSCANLVHSPRSGQPKGERVLAHVELEIQSSQVGGSKHRVLGFDHDLVFSGLGDGALCDPQLTRSGLCDEFVGRHVCASCDCETGTRCVSVGHGKSRAGLYIGIAESNAAPDARLLRSQPCLTKTLGLEGTEESRMLCNSANAGKGACVAQKSSSKVRGLCSPHKQKAWLVVLNPE